MYRFWYSCRSAVRRSNVIVDELVANSDLGDYHLGGRDPPSEVAGKLLQMRVPIKAIWNGDSCRWELYRIKGNKLIWQKTAPKGDLTTSIIKWLEKFDSSDHGRMGDVERIKDFKFWFNHVREDKDKKRKRDLDSETMYACRNINQFLKRVMGGNRQCVVPAGPVVGILKSGKKIRAYKKW